MKDYKELEKERSLQEKGELVYYIFSVDEKGLCGCIGYTNKDEALEYIKRLNKPCEMKTYQIIETNTYNDKTQLSMF